MTKSEFDALVLRVAYAMYRDSMKRAGHQKDFIKQCWDDKPSIRPSWKAMARVAIKEINKL